MILWENQQNWQTFIQTDQKAEKTFKLTKSEMKGNITADTEEIHIIIRSYFKNSTKLENLKKSDSTYAIVLKSTLVDESITFKLSFLKVSVD